MTFCLCCEGWTWMVLLNFGYGEGSDSSHSQTWRIKRTQFSNPKYLSRKFKNVIFLLSFEGQFWEWKCESVFNEKSSKCHIKMVAIVCLLWYFGSCVPGVSIPRFFRRNLVRKNSCFRWFYKKKNWVLFIKKK